MTREQIIAHLAIHGWQPVQTTTGWGAINPDGIGYTSNSLASGAASGSVSFLAKNMPRAEWPNWDYVPDHVLGTIERNGFKPVDPHATRTVAIQQQEFQRAQQEQFYESLRRQVSQPLVPTEPRGYWDVQSSAGDPPSFMAQLEEQFGRLDEQAKQKAREKLLDKPYTPLKFP